MSDYYKGQRRFALGGKGWTVVLGCVVSLSYIRAKAKLSHEDFSQAHHTLKDRRGEDVKFDDQPEVPQHEDIVLRLWRRLPETPLPNLYWVGGIFTAFWAYRMWGSFNRLMVIRYADINYQLRRPDVLANKVVALKYLALPLTLVPLLMLGGVAFSAWWCSSEVWKASAIWGWWLEQLRGFILMLEDDHGATMRPWRLGLALVAAEPCQDRLGDDAVVQFTAEACSCCYDLDKFIQDNDYVYALFYSAKGRLNIDIRAKFEQLAREWKWSRIHFGRIDVDKDRDMSKRWVESNMVPTNVMYKFGRPVEVKPKDFEVIRDKYQGNPDGQKWMLTKYMGEDAQGSNLHYATVLPSMKKHSKFLKNNQVAIIGYFKKEGDREHKVYLEAIWKLFQHVDKDDIGAGIGSVFAQSVLKQVSTKPPSIVLYLDGKVMPLDGYKAMVERWTVQAVVDFIKQYNVLSFIESEHVSGEL